MRPYALVSRVRQLSHDSLIWLIDKWTVYSLIITSHQFYFLFEFSFGELEHSSSSFLAMLKTSLDLLLRSLVVSIQTLLSPIPGLKYHRFTQIMDSFNIVSTCWVKLTFGQLDRTSTINTDICWMPCFWGYFDLQNTFGRNHYRSKYL